MERRFVDEHRALEEQIEDLASSLHATTDVLSAADRMINHYRDVNHTQEEEITRLQHATFDRTGNSSYQQNGPFSSTPNENQKKKKSKTIRRAIQKSKVDGTSSSESEGFVGILSHLSETQEKLKREIHNDQHKRAEELDRLHAALRRNEAAAREEKQESERNRKLNALEQDVKSLKQDTVITGAIGTSQEHLRQSRFDAEQRPEQTDKQTIATLRNVVAENSAENARMFAELTQLKQESRTAYQQQNQLVKTLQELRHQLQREFEDRKLLQRQVEVMETQTNRIRSTQPNHSDEMQKANENLKNQNEYLYNELSSKKAELQQQASDLTTSTRTIRKLSEEGKLDKRKWQSEKEHLIQQHKSLLDELADVKMSLSVKENELTSQLVTTGETERKTANIMKQYRQKYTELQDSEKRLLTENSQLQSDIKVLKKKLNDADKLNTNAALKSSNYEAMQLENQRLKDEVHQLNYNSNDFNQELENMQQMLSQERILNQQRVTKLESEIARILSADESSNRKSRQQFKEMEDLHQKECEEWEGQYEILENNVNRLQQELKMCQTDLGKTKNSLDSARDHAERSSKEWQSQRNYLENKIAELEKKSKDSNSRVSVLEVELRKARKRSLDNKESNKESLATICRQLDLIMQSKRMNDSNNLQDQTTDNNALNGVDFSMALMKNKVDHIASYVKCLEDELSKQSELFEQHQNTNRAFEADVEASHVKLSKCEEKNRELKNKVNDLSTSLRHAEVENTGMARHLEECVKMMEQNTLPDLHQELMDHLSDVREQHLYVIGMTDNCTVDRSQLEGLQMELTEASATQNDHQDEAISSLDLASRLILDISDSVLVDNRRRTSDKKENNKIEFSANISPVKRISSHRPVPIDELSKRPNQRSSRYYSHVPWSSKLTNVKN